MENLDLIKDKIPETKLKNSTLLFLDVSSSCTGYSIFAVNFIEKKAALTKAGCIWLDQNWEHAKKYDYLYNAIQNYFEVVEQVDYIVVEQYSVNKDRMSGVLVSPEAHGVIKAAAFSNGVSVGSITPQTWRAQLSIKPHRVGLKKDYKTPCKDLIKSLVDVPEEVISNLTQKPRQTPSDLYDAVGIGLGWLKKYTINKIDYKNCHFNSHIGILDE